VLSPALLGVLREAAIECLCPIGLALAAALPAGSAPRSARGFQLTPRGREALASAVLAAPARRLLARLAQIAVERDCGRMEWSVLDWNTPARDLYFKLGAKSMDEWTVFRLTGDALVAFAAAD